MNGLVKRVVIPSPTRHEDLCETCKKIDLRSLFPDNTSTPLFNSDIQTKWLRPGERGYQGPRAQYDLGSFMQIENRSQYCEMCRFIVGTLRRRSLCPRQPSESDCLSFYRLEMKWFVEVVRDSSAKQTVPFGTIQHIALCAEIQSENSQDSVARASYNTIQAALDTGMLDYGFKSFIISNRSENSVFGLGRIRPPMCDVDLFKSWLTICESRHTDRCSSSGSGLPPTLRLWNTTTGRLCNVSKLENRESLRYAALSYVWGGHQEVCLKKDNLRIMETRGFPRGSKIPKTISDAITLVSLMGIQYIWIDSLCIIQDCFQDQQSQIPTMGMIYNNAIITVVAAANDSVHGGLPGISGPNRDEPDVLRLENIALITTAEPTPGFMNFPLWDSKWLTRGWTLQESILSRRRLIFSEQQVYWECETCSWCEENNFESETLTHDLGREGDAYPPMAIRLRSLVGGEPEFLTTFETLVTHYCSREFTNELDVRDAIQGIFSYITVVVGASRKFCWGLLEPSFENQLSWYGAIDERRITGVGTSSTLVPFPSWSWMSWKGRIRFSRIKSSIQCYTLDKSRQPRTCQRLSDSKFPTTLTWIRGHRCEVTDKDIESIEREAHIIPGNHIFFWTSSAVFHISWLDRGEAGRRCLIGPKKIRKRQSKRTKLSNEDFGDLWECRPSIRGVDGQHEFIVLGEYEAMIRIMLISWSDGVARRDGLGEVSENLWLQADRSWKLIMLG